LYSRKGATLLFWREKHFPSFRTFRIFFLDINGKTWHAWPRTSKGWSCGPKRGKFISLVIGDAIRGQASRWDVMSITVCGHNTNVRFSATRDAPHNGLVRNSEPKKLMPIRETASSAAGQQDH
jgi:hypothetical protein